MLLSSVALVAKTKTGKGKDGTEKKAEKKWFYEFPATTESEDTCEQCKKEIEEDNYIFQFPSIVPSSTDKGQGQNNTGDRVTIATGDDFCFCVERFYYTIVLREESRADMTCVFRKKVLETKTVPNGRVETVVFALDCDQEFYITASAYGDLELNYHPSCPKAEEPDERVFDVYFTNLGHVLIQPKLYNNSYLHHLDKSLSVQPLDLNWRCPEEYFFHFNAVPESVQKTETKKVCTHAKNNLKQTCSLPPEDNNDKEESTCESSQHSDQTYVQKLSAYGTQINLEELKQTLDKYAIELPTRKVSKKKVGLSRLFLGCFSAKSHKIAF